MLSREEATSMLENRHVYANGVRADSGITDLFVDSTCFSRQQDFELLMRWMCGRSDYLVFAESVLAPEAPLAEDFLSEVFGGVAGVAASHKRYGTFGQCTTCYFLTCHPGQFDPLMSFMTGLHDYGAGCPVDDLAFVDAAGLARLVTVTHEELAWLTIARSELAEARAQGQGWVSALR